MKKILVFLLLCFYTVDVSALTYSQYTEFSEYQDKVINSDELTDVKTQRRYKYYKLNKQLGPYEEENILNNDYPYIDYGDRTYIESDYQNEKPEEKPDRIITKHTIYHYKKVKDINSIQITNISEDIDINLKNISIQYKSASLDYEIEYKDATISAIKPKGYIKINFKDMLVTKDLKLFINTNMDENSDAILCINGFNNNQIISENKFSFENQQNINYNFANLRVVGNGFEPYNTEEQIIPCPALILTGTTINYKYKDLVYRKYNLEKEYYQDYLISPYADYIYKDENLYKDYYAKRTREVIKKQPIQELLKENKETFTNNLKKLDINENNINNKTEKPSMLLQIDSDKILKNSKHKDQVKKQIPPYSIIFLLIFIILILVLSKLYKKKN